MSTIVFLIEQVAPALYILVTIALFTYWRRWRHARYAYRAAGFELERAVTRYKIGGAFTMMLLSIEAGLIVFGVQNIVAPTVREDRALTGIVESFQAVPDDGPFRTPTSPPPSGQLPIDASGYDLGSQQELQIRLTPVPTNTPVGTIEPAPAPSGCTDDHAFLSIPTNGMRVFQTIRVEGTAYHDNFSSYKIEISGPGTLNQFVVLDEGTLPVTETGTLSQFDPTPYEPGIYQFQLMVFDTTTTLKAHCRITIRISEPVPTPTPFN